MTNRRTLPPLTGTPLDYPIHATPQPYKPTRYRAPTLRRSLIAGAVAAVAVGIAAIAPAVALGALAIAFVSGGIWLANKLIKAIDSHDD